MLAMDQFKDVRGYTAYAARLAVGPADVLKAMAQVAFNETIGEAIGFTVGPKHVALKACDPDLVSKHITDTQRSAVIPKNDRLEVN